MKVFLAGTRAPERASPAICWRVRPKAGQELLVSLVTGGVELPDPEGLVEHLRSAHPQLVGVAHAVNTGRAELSAGIPSTMLWGRPSPAEKIRGLTLKVSLDAFFQTNTFMAERLYELVAEEVARSAGHGNARRRLAPMPHLSSGTSAPG